MQCNPIRASENKTPQVNSLRDINVFERGPLSLAF